MRKSEITQRKLDIAAFADAEEGIRQGLEDLKNGKGRPAEEVFAKFEKRHGLASPPRTSPESHRRGKTARRLRAR